MRSAAWSSQSSVVEMELTKQSAVSDCNRDISERMCTNSRTKQILGSGFLDLGDLLAGDLIDSHDVFFDLSFDFFFASRDIVVSEFLF